MRISDVYLDFKREVNLITGLQVKVNSALTLILQPERVLLYESLFMRLFRSYENFLENSFISYMVGEPSVAGRRPEVSVNILDVDHVRRMLIGSAPFLDWSKPVVIKDRCRLWFAQGEDRFYNGVVSSMSVHGYAKDIRNHIAHNSVESKISFDKVVKSLHLVPKATDRPGDILAEVPTKGPARGTEVLSYFSGELHSVAKFISECP